MLHVLNIEEIDNDTVKITFNDSNRSVSITKKQSETIESLILDFDRAIVAAKGKRKTYTEAELLYMQSQVEMMGARDEYEVDIPVIKVTPEAIEKEENRVSHIKPSQTIKELLSHVDSSIDYIVDNSDLEVKNFTNIELEYMKEEVRLFDKMGNTETLKKDVIKEINSHSNHTLRINMITLQR